MTAPPLLQLRSDVLSTPFKLDLAVIEAMMLWPDDDAARGRWIAASIVEWGWENIETMPEAQLRRWALDARAARGMPSNADLQPEANKRHPHGTVAGAIVLEAIMLGRLAPDQAAVRKVQESLADRLKGSFQIEPKTMNNKAGPIYPFRPVAHLWAAHGAAWRGGDKTFPCKASRLGEFLAIAEVIRAVAEHSRVKKSPSTVMRPGEAVRLPAEITAALPAVNLPEYALTSFPG